jgi:hypothetical protein
MARTVRPVLATFAAVAVLALAACSGVQPDRDPTGVITESVEGADIFAIEVGDCAGDLTEGEVTELDVIPCADPHGSEAYASFVMDDGDFPGAEAIEAQGIEDCGAAFEEFVGLPYEDSELFATWLTPTTESWDGGDREILCFVYDDGVETTGSLENAAR